MTLQEALPCGGKSGRVRAPAHREHRFRRIVNADSGIVNSDSGAS
jgi:hypothetical protein